VQVTHQRDHLVLIVSAALFFIARKNRHPLCPPPRYDGWEIRDLLWR